MNIQTIIFSKDRPLQLHGTLESLRLRCREGADIPVSVIHKASSADFAQGYQSLQSEFRDAMHIEWVDESDFKKDLLTRIEVPGPAAENFFQRVFGGPRELRSRFVMFLVDDNLFVRDFSLVGIGEVLEMCPKALGFSLRVGRNTTYCYSNQCPQRLPKFREVADGILGFRWVGEQGDFNYPLEVSSSVYRTADLARLLKSLPYSNPNRLEQGLSVSSRLFAGRRPELLCFATSSAFCAPVNKVQSILDNPSGNAKENSPEALNEIFLAGDRIDVEALREFTPVSAHQEIELPIRRITGR